MKTRKSVISTRPPRRKRVTFRLAGGSGHTVCLAGSFNQWDPAAHPLTWDDSGRAYTTTVMLPVGRHEYKFVIDGAWDSDPNAPESTPNGHGTLNSVITVA